MEQPIRTSLLNSEVYLVFDSHFIYLFIGQQCPQYYIEELFEVSQIN